MPSGFESLIAFLQALVFTVPICGYLSDALHMHPQIQGLVQNSTFSYPAVHVLERRCCLSAIHQRCREGATDDEFWIDAAGFKPASNVSNTQRTTGGVLAQTVQWW